MVETLDPKVGGVAPAVLSLSRALAARGHKVEIVTLDEPATVGAVADRGPGSATPATDIDLVVHGLGVGLTSYRYSKRLQGWLRENASAYDCVIVNGLWQYLGLAAWRQFRDSTTPYYVFPHGMLDPWFKRTFPLKHLKKWFYWPWGEYRVLRDATAVIFTSEEERIQARESFWLYSANERVSPLGLESAGSNPQEFKEKFLTRYPQLRESKALLFLGRLHPKKGCDLLIEALADIDDFSLIIAGPDQIGWQKELSGRADKAGLTDRVVFTGMLEGEMKRGAFATADAFILPSHQENFGMSVAEALAAGVPVLISNRVNIWREIDADRAGYVENDDLPGTRRLIERWRNTSPEEQAGMRRNAQQCFTRRFQIDRAVDSLLSILNETVRAK